MNYVYKCLWKSTGQEPNSVLVRIYGKTTSLINNLLVLNILAERNLGTKCYGYNEEGRIEELYTCVPVERSQQQSGVYFELIANKLAEIHTQDMLLSKAPTFLFDFALPAGISEDAVMKINSFDFKQNLREIIRATADLKSEVVFSHNGLTKEDVLQLTEELDLQLPSLKLVDFEYSAYNYRAYDLSMLFIECCIEYRNKDTRPYFDFNSEDYFAPEIRKQICKAYLIARSNTGVPTDGEVNRLFHETEICELAVHLVWTIWGVDQHIRRETIPFGYLEYAVAHLEEYTKKMKDLKNRGLIKS
ncbi:CHK [Mytilus edulis]|uniref:CHK n=1 Tax=Mytilus edulis TaxID=6550 RepID=A0A8S3UQC5_MYTED|nr:CHK [Mytilus edulis]